MRIDDPARRATAALSVAALVAACAGDDATPPRAPASIELASPTMPPKPWPPGMVWIPGGTFRMGGVGPEARPDEFPVHKVRVHGFWMDETEVTNSQFHAFVQAKGYVTTAERKPEWEELRSQLPPGTPKPDESTLVPGSMVFTPTDGPVPLDDWSRWWSWVPGADWKHPLGPGSSLGDDHDQHPVVHVSWDDCVAYCEWAGKRLPTEAEWEFAARGGVDGERFGWGDEPPTDTYLPANLWQGGFPYEKSPLDGFLLAAPVKSFAPNRFGLYDTIGNVWEWCADWYRADYYATLAASSEPDGVAIDPPGPDTFNDPAEPTMPKRVNRGGSFLCHHVYCASYRPSARMRTAHDTSQIHLGFRAVMDDAAWRARVAETRTRAR